MGKSGENFTDLGKGGKDDGGRGASPHLWGLETQRRSASGGGGLVTPPPPGSPAWQRVRLQIPSSSGRKWTRPRTAPPRLQAEEGIAPRTQRPWRLLLPSQAPASRKTFPAPPRPESHLGASGSSNSKPETERRRLGARLSGSSWPRNPLRGASRLGGEWLNPRSWWCQSRAGSSKHQLRELRLGSSAAASHHYRRRQVASPALALPLTDASKLSSYLHASPTQPLSTMPRCPAARPGARGGGGRQRAPQGGEGDSRRSASQPA